MSARSEIRISRETDKISRAELGQRTHDFMNSLLTGMYDHPAVPSNGDTQIATKEARMKAVLATKNPLSFRLGNHVYQVSYHSTDPEERHIGADSTTATLKITEFKEKQIDASDLKKGKEFTHVASTELKTRYRNSAHGRIYLDGDVVTTVTGDRYPAVSRSEEGLNQAMCIFEDLYILPKTA